jgi:hypothetical protein
MILSYIANPFNDDDSQKHERIRVEAEITTEHPLSSYGLPVVVLDDGLPIDRLSWILLGYKIEKITKREKPLMETWLSQFGP